MWHIGGIKALCRWACVKQIGSDVCGAQGTHSYAMDNERNHIARSKQQQTTRSASSFNALYAKMVTENGKKSTTINNNWFKHYSFLFTVVRMYCSCRHNACSGHLLRTMFVEWKENEKPHKYSIFNIRAEEIENTTTAQTAHTHTQWNIFLEWVICNVDIACGKCIIEFFDSFSRGTCGAN